jgi:RNA polymerase sigma-70 factor (ECF subfamily)
MKDSPVRDALGGSREALERVYERSAPRLLAFIRLRMGRTLRSKMESRDILQATLMKSFQHFDEFKGSDTQSLGAWLARIAEREIADRVDFHQRQRRDAAREEPLDIEAMGAAVPAPVKSALTQAILDEKARHLEAAMDTLSDAHREIILLRKFEELSFGEIARRLDKSEDACRMLLARAMVALTLAMTGRPTP